MHPGDPYNTDEEEDRRLRREYEALPKTPWHGEETPNHHPDIRPEWVVRVIREPYDQQELGCVDISPQPDESGSEMKEAKVSGVQLLKPGEDPAVMLYFVDEAFHQMTLPV